MPTDQPRISDRRDAEISQYKSVCATAVLGLLLGLLSPLAVVSRSLLLVPLLGIAVCSFGLWRISRHADELIGRKAAVIGLAFCCLFGAATGSQHSYRNWLLAGEAEQFASIWLEQLAANRPYNACQLFLPRDQRRILDDKLGDFYRSHPKLRASMDEKFLSIPPVKKLLAAGTTAKVQSVRTIGVWQRPKFDFVRLMYSISYEEGGSRTTIPVELGMERKPHADGTASWRMVDALIESDDEP